ncbi:Pyruvate/2-oxoglutarate dehydrogenase complex, dihydrolipoamide dehydrogenase (E3) component, and related enzymes [Paenibacillus uliginis N3/975]|uniref:Pyruvate/2-oxoglutarate dehydrogenase complex, dihydrolipoamide dehydrogenase (E3) component, and related enzymes n=1 Tax=Paenibacillus uliginis N3/975 TaxID=1313296 RepID=A0A1X7HM73_9BACL|nr:FAD-dependent oxidoreductase [Paenibacillus uliginis]SMF88822.1 Pyruvate/2-oxoglutarate dehydrogenase complex, dihydrolipoamide dehydrogenase (E3) component, and related enzymes [Paenibacillus uliginis N3/975]
MVKELHADIVILGGGTGGTAAALAAAKSGKNVIMTEETRWIGGQLTSQAVPPDEHPWIESFGCTRSYRQFREGVRQYYRNHFPLTAAARADIHLNPGGGIVSRLCHEPRTALAVLQEMLAPYIHSGRLKIMYEYVLEQAEVTGDQVSSVTVKSLNTDVRVILHAPMYLDATECGDLLPAAGVEYVTGAESKAETGEPHAVDGEAMPMDMQGFTYCYAVDYMENEDHTIDKPEQYSFWCDYKPEFWPDHLLSLSGVKPATMEPVRYEIFPDTEKFSLFMYRQILNQKLFQEGAFQSPISLINWPQNDYWLGSVIDVSEEERRRHLYGAKQLSLSLLYWLQTEAPRPDGKQGYPGLRLRPDVVGTEDGLAMYPYIRESRRIQAEFTVLEQHVATNSRPDGKAETFHDSVGIGCYRIDLHPSTAGQPYIDISSLPFQIPLGSLIPKRVTNVLAACKNIGVTHITNGCYRLHPVEWNIGEAAGYCASYCLDRNLPPTAVRNDETELSQFQKRLTQEGIELQWPTIHSV